MPGGFVSPTSLPGPCGRTSICRQLRCGEAIRAAVESDAAGALCAISRAGSRGAGGFWTGRVGHGDGKRKRPHLFRVVLSHSRRGYSEVVWRQTTESFIRCIENGFRYYGGVARTLVIDNLRAAVTRADWYDPEINPKWRKFAGHYSIRYPLPNEASHAPPQRKN